MQLFTTHTVNVYRLEESGSKESYGLTPVYENVDCQVTPASEDVIAIYGGGQTFSLVEIFFTANIELKNGDKLVAGQESWIVRDAPVKVSNRFVHYTRVIGGVVV